MNVRDYIAEHTDIDLTSIRANDEIIIIVEVPHQRKSDVFVYIDEDDYKDTYIAAIEETDHSGEIEEALEDLETDNRTEAAELVAAQDLHSWRKLVGTESILDFEPVRHQEVSVLSQIANVLGR